MGSAGSMMRLFNAVLVADEPWSPYSANVLSQLAIRESSKESARHLGSQSDYESSASMRHGLFRNVKDLLRWVRIALPASRAGAALASAP
jgi:hypothetical protein